jgi:hypothetical protein
MISGISNFARISILSKKNYTTTKSKLSENYKRKISSKLNKLSNQQLTTITFICYLTHSYPFSNLNPINNKSSQNKN